ncbi:MAG: hypothetical protein II222_05755 [Paraprevotella sp.]|nr:hypothetical protein [Paraprevotella sp.]
MWLLIYQIFLLLAIAFCCVIAFIFGYALITDKKYREEAWEDLKRRSRERKRPYFSDRQYKRYLRTGNRHHLVYDYDDEEDDK